MANVTRFGQNKVVDTTNMYRVHFPVKQGIIFEQKETVHDRILHLQEKYERDHTAQTYLDEYGVA